MPQNFFFNASEKKNLMDIIMTGGLMQLVAYGAQDIYLTGNPMITYFKVVYRRHTNFAMESIAQTFNGTVGFGNKVTALISRNGDLVSGLTLEATLPALAGTNRWTEDVGHHLIEEVSIDIGGQQIDKHYSDWLEIWAQLTVPASQQQGYRNLIGQAPRAATLGEPTGLQTAIGAAAVSAKLRKVYVPLQFWFCRNVGLALPLIALQYHEVKVNIKFQTLAAITLENDGTISTATGTLSAELFADYIYLDTDERRRFAQVSHEYLIEQLQFNGDSSYAVTVTTTESTQSIDLNFNHPVKELVWVSRMTSSTTIIAQRSNYTDTAAASIAPAETIIAGALEKSTVTLQNMTNPTDPWIAQGAGVGSANNPTQGAKLQLNGHDRFAARDGTYFNLVQPLAHHTSVPESPGINVYSFALKPEDHQPSGTCNFSRIDNAKLVLNLGGVKAVGAGVTKVYATNYNVLRIMSGMGGLAYSN
jgi:hypothetical protein